MKADWDLSSSHTMQDVDWSDPSIDALDVRPIESVHLSFPDGSTFAADDGIKRIGLTRKGDEVDEVRVFADPATVDDAYALAKRWAERWDIPTANLDRWHAAGGSVEQRVVAYDPKARPLGDNGPTPTLEIIDSAVDDKPAQVVLNFAWVEAAA